MALIDRVREVWDDLRGTRKEEQETASIGQSVGDSLVQSTRDYAPAVNPREYEEPVSLAAQSNQTDSAVRVARPSALEERDQYMEGMPDGYKQVNNASALDRADSRSPDVTYVPRPAYEDTMSEQYNYDVSEWRLQDAVGYKHSSEFKFEKELGNLDTYKHDPTGSRIHLDSNGNFYDVQEGKEPTLTTRAEVLKAYQEPTSEMAAAFTPEHREIWVPLEKELGFTGADAFHHYGTRGDVQVYMTYVEDSKRLIGIDDKGQFYDVNKGGHGGLISREDALEHLRLEPSFYTPGERTLREAVGFENVPDLVRDGKSGNIQSYQNTNTRGHLHLDSDGKFYNSELQVISRGEALSTMQTVGGDGTRSIALARAAYAPEEVLNRVSPEMPRSQGTVQPAVQEQSISM